MANAETFFKAFVSSYYNKKKQKSGIWNDIWSDTNKWSCFMIYNDDSVVRGIASELDLKCFPREPLHIDAVFTKTQEWSWFPISIAVEHENDPSGFHGEIEKLMSIDCPLKVGITYSILGDKKVEYVRNKIEKSFFESLEMVKTIGERSCEYVFIIGNEIEGHEKEIFWEYAVFQQSSKSRHLEWRRHINDDQ